MKTKILHVVVVSCFLGLLPVKTVALNYTITFTGTGASTTIDSVIVQNLTKGTTVTVPAGNVLNLSDAVTAVEQVSISDETIRVYPASVTGKSIVSFFAKQAGVTQLSAFSLDGRKVAGISTGLQTGINTFELKLPKGVFVIQVTGNEYAYTAKMLNPSGTQGKPEIVYTGTEKPASSSPQKSKNSILGTTTMAYTANDQLLYKATSGTYNTIVTDVPTGSKTTNFNFTACTDADGNNYTAVTIGTQTWMVENLKTTKYNDDTAILLVTDNTAWTKLSTPAYCWYNNDTATYKNKYGALYNWYAVNTGKLAPTGWHVPTDAEWITLTDYVTANLGTSLTVAKALAAATTDWTTYSDNGSVGCDLTLNNSTGFSALPGGYRLNVNGTFDLVGGYGYWGYGYWWSSIEHGTYGAWGRSIYYSYSGVIRSSHNGQMGFSVRCVRDSQ